VRQYGEVLAEQYRPHAGTDVAHRVSAKVNAAAANNVCVPASQLVKDAFLEENVDSTR